MQNSPQKGSTKATLINKRDNPHSAFTIVELLIVIVIIGILAAITIVSYTGITKKANETAIISDLTNASKKLTMYYTEYNTYPTAIDINTGCPTAPHSDANYCLKYGSGTKLIYNYKTPNTYELNFIKNNLVYETASDKTPTVSSNWLTIGTQTWAKTNLNVGTMIPGTSEQTNNSIIEKYCYENNESNCTTYGALYQWNEAMQYSTTEGSQGLCPTGSHIPTDAEWKTLEMHLGMTQAQADATSWRGTDQGTQLKPNSSSGLNVPFAGTRGTDGSFYDLSSIARLWSSSEDSSNAWGRSLATFQSNVFRGVDNKVYGFSVRCLAN